MLKLPCEVVWGHHTTVDEQYDENFTNHWTGGTIGGAADNDNETITLQNGESSESDDWALGVCTAVIEIDKYQAGSGSTPTIEYKTAATKAGLVGASWNIYGGAFSSLGWVKIKVSY